MSQAYLVLVCRCGKREVLTPPVDCVLIAVATSGWRMTTGTTRYDTCPACILAHKLAPRNAARARVLDALKSILVVRQQAVIAEWIGRGP
jgi:hypothetical protein